LFLAKVILQYSQFNSYLQTRCCGSISCCVGMCCGAVARCASHVVLCKSYAAENAPGQPDTFSAAYDYTKRHAATAPN